MCLRLRCPDKVGESMLSGHACRARLTLAVGPTGLEVQTASSKKHFQDKPVELQIPRLRSG